MFQPVSARSTDWPPRPRPIAIASSARSPTRCGKRTTFSIAFTASREAIPARRPPSIRERPDAPAARLLARSVPSRRPEARASERRADFALPARSTLMRAGNRDSRSRLAESGPRTRGSHPDIAVGVDDDARVPAGRGAARDIQRRSDSSGCRCFQLIGALGELLVSDGEERDSPGIVDDHASAIRASDFVVPGARCARERHARHSGERRRQRQT